uniref:Neuroparsin 1 n=1 Tax=Plautia stali TaxID=106108 RepID=A0A1E1G7T3_PLAST|nr:neuroparsin 1 [Plautia stali]
MISSSLVLVGFVWTTYASRISCGGIDCDKKPENCTHGSVEIRKKWACGKGPGEICGGYLDAKGKCGSGMYCDNCGLCRGCSSKLLIDHNRLECNRNPCTEHHHALRKRLASMRNF